MSKDRWVAEGVHERRGLQTALYNAEKYQNVSISPVFQQWVIVDVIFDPTVVDEKKYEQLKKKYEDFPIANLDLFAKNKILPRNSVIARKVIKLAEGNKYDADKSKILLPFFPPALSLPCKPGEHVWVMFEYLNVISDVGYWICSVVGSGATDDVNHSHYPRILEGTFIEGNAGDKWKETSLDGTPTSQENPKYRFEESTFFLQDKKIYENALTNSEASFASVYESVPRFKKRPGDIAFEGSNNTLIVLGRDRIGKAVEYASNIIPNDPLQNGAKNVKNDPNAYYKKRNAGSIDIVAGRGQKKTTAGKTAINTLLNPELDKSRNSLMDEEGDPDFKNDRSRIYVSQNTEIDKNLELKNYNSIVETQDSVEGDSGIIIKADKTRIFSRSDVQILVTGFNSSEKLVDVTENAPNRQDLKDEALSKTKDIIKDQKDDSKSWASVTITSRGDIISRVAENRKFSIGPDSAAVESSKALLTLDSDKKEIITPLFNGGKKIVGSNNINQALSVFDNNAKTVSIGGGNSNALFFVDVTNKLITIGPNLAKFNLKTGMIDIGGGAMIVAGPPEGSQTAPGIETFAAKNIAYAEETTAALQQIVECLNSIQQFLAKYGTSATPPDLIAAAALAATTASIISAKVPTITQNLSKIATKSKIQ